MPWPDLFWAELASRLKERFGASIRSRFFCFLHLLTKGNITPPTSTTTPTAIKSHKAQPLEAGVGVGVGATAAGELTGSLDEVSVVTGITALAGVVLADTAGVVVAAAGVSVRFRE